MHSSVMDEPVSEEKKKKKKKVDERRKKAAKRARPGFLDTFAKCNRDYSCRVSFLFPSKQHVSIVVFFSPQNNTCQ